MENRILRHCGCTNHHSTSKCFYRKHLTDKKLVRKYLLSGTLFIAAALPTVAESDTDIGLSELLQLSLAELQTIQVYTASRDFTPMNQAPSVMTVITAEQIKRQGLKTLSEVLQRVPGFFMDYRSSTLPSYVYHRGALTGNSSGVLFLLDGVPQNFQYAYGVDTQHVFPNLYHVKRIEVVRGSSSTLWGSDASTGVINIITYDGDELDELYSEYGKFNGSYDHQFQDERHIANLNWARQFEQGSAMFNITYSESDADLIGSWHGTSARYVGWDTIRASHDLYFKGTYQDLSLLARHARFGYAGTQSFSTATFTPELDNDLAGEREMELETLGLAHSWFINDSYSLDNSMYYIRQSTGRSTINGSTIGAFREDEFAEKKYTVDMILRHQATDWKNKIGLHWNLIDFGGTSKSSVEHLPGIEHTHAAFFESEYIGIDDLILTAGVRFDRNDLRSNNEDTNIMPRFSAVYTLSPEWSLRYAYSTGIVRPQRVYNIGDGWTLRGIGASGKELYAAGTRTSQKTTTNELQLTYHTREINVAATLFHADAENSFTWLYKVPTDPPDTTNVYHYWYGNIDNIRSQGIELEFGYLPADYLRLYGNATYQSSEYRSPYASSLDGIDRFELFETGQRTLRVPNTMWNLGVDYDMTDQLSLNIHYRGFRGVKLSNDHEEGTVDYVDLNLRYDNAFNIGLDTALYGKNVFDNQPREGLSGFYESGLEVGVTASFQF